MVESAFRLIVALTGGLFEFRVKPECVFEPSRVQYFESSPPIFTSGPPARSMATTWCRQGSFNGRRSHPCKIPQHVGRRHVRRSRCGCKFVPVILIDDTLLSTEIFDRRFCCDLKACKGACCVEGESGAPLEPEELAEVEKAFEVVKDRLKPESLAVIEREGLHVVDGDGDFVTPIVEGKECVYATFDADGTAKCAFEQAHLEGKLTWRKPISCHLYPIRLTALKDLTAVNYHRWPICDGALSCGAGLDLSVLRFCKDALIRKFGQAWYDAACEAELQWRQVQAQRNQGDDNLAS